MKATNHTHIPPAVANVLLGESPHPAGAFPLAERVLELRLFVLFHLLVKHVLHVPDTRVEQPNVQRHRGDENTTCGLGSLASLEWELDQPLANE